MAEGLPRSIAASRLASEHTVVPPWSIGGEGNAALPTSGSLHAPLGNKEGHSLASTALAAAKEADRVTCMFECLAEDSEALLCSLNREGGLHFGEGEQHHPVGHDATVSENVLSANTRESLRKRGRLILVWRFPPQVHPHRQRQLLLKWSILVVHFSYIQ